MSEQEPAPRTPAPPNLGVFIPAAAAILVLVGIAAIIPERIEALFERVQMWIVSEASWFLVLVVATILLLAVYLGASRHGEVKLGPDHSEPEFSKLSWFAMLFSAGMGIGLMFFGVAEPVMHFAEPPIGEGQTVEAARQAMKLTFFHWGLHAWAIYAVVGLILAYFSFRRGLPLTLRSALYPLIGDRIYGPIGNAVDVFAIVSTIFGVATSLGYGVLQVNSGLGYLFGLPETTTTQIILIAVITGFAGFSVVTGLDSGIKRLSELNLSLAALLVLFIVILGPTSYLLQTFVQNTGAYVADLVSLTFNLYAYEPTDWLGGWTLLYWGWWLSWSPFVGLFIARISRGRTIREFIGGVLFVPAGFTLAWMTVFGNSAIALILTDVAPGLVDAVAADSSVALFQFLEYFPLSGVLSFIATIMVIVFFVTSSDSGSMVVDMLASNGRDDTAVWQKLFWVSTEGIVAIVLLLAGGLAALQTATIATALPFSLILLTAIAGLLRALGRERHKADSLDMTVRPGPLQPAIRTSGLSWKERFQSLVHFPERDTVEEFIDSTIRTALEDVAAQFEAQGMKAQLSFGEGKAELRVDHGREVDFLYGVRIRSKVRPAFAWKKREAGKSLEEANRYYVAEVFLHEGGQGYDLLGYTDAQVIHDLLEQYEKHLFYLDLVRA